MIAPLVNQAANCNDHKEALEIVPEGPTPSKIGRDIISTNPNHRLRASDLLAFAKQDRTSVVAGSP